MQSLKEEAGGEEGGGGDYTVSRQLSGTRFRRNKRNQAKANQEG